MTGKKWLGLMVALIVIGCIVFGGVMTMLKWDFRKLSTVQYETNSHEFRETVRSIFVETDTADVEFVQSDEAYCRVECHEQAQGKHTVTLEEGILRVKKEEQDPWWKQIGINFSKPKITVYLPYDPSADLLIQGADGNVLQRFLKVDISVRTGNVALDSILAESVRIETTTGAISVDNIAAPELTLSASTGKITASRVSCGGEVQLRVTTGKTELTDISCQTLTSRGDTGAISMKNVCARGMLTVERSTGNVYFDRCDAGELLIKTDTGNVTGTLLTPKIFLASTDTGRVEVPESITGGKCKITTDTGDIKLSIAE